MARKLKHDNLPEIVGMNLNPARDTIEFLFEKNANLKARALVLAHQTAMALCKLAAQRILADGWMYQDKLCYCPAGNEATKLLHRARMGIIKASGARLVIENNGLKSYRLGIDADALSFTIDDLDRCDDQQVIALVKMVAMKRPEAVNGICSAEAEPTEAEPTEQQEPTKEVEPSGRG